MTEQKKTNYTFESQLELGEMLLNLGRIAEAETELKKARDLNEVGAFTTPEDSPQRQTDLQRLTEALARVEEMQGATERRNRRLALLAALLLVVVTAGVFTLWALNRAALIETRATATQEAELAALQATENAADVQFAQRENTRTAEQISDLYRELGRIAAEGTRVAAVIGVAPEMATAAAQNADTNATIVAMMAVIAAESTLAVQQATQNAANPPADTGVSNPTPVVGITTTPIPPGALGDLLDQLRITTFAANMRSGPGFNYFVIGGLDEGEIVTAIAQSEDRYWYNVETATGRRGWVHTSLAKPLTLDWLPIAATQPAFPFVPPSPDESQTPEPSPSPTRQPTDVPTPTATATLTDTTGGGGDVTLTVEPLPTVVITATQTPTATLESIPTVEATATPTATPTPEESSALPTATLSLARPTTSP